MELTTAQRRFCPYGRSANILRYLDACGPARSTYSFIRAVGHYSTRYHYAACDRLAREGLIAREWVHGQSRNVRITDAGRALLAAWEREG